jgi:hypothetical protein
MGCGMSGLHPAERTQKHQKGEPKAERGREISLGRSKPGTGKFLIVRAVFKVFFSFGS